MRGIILIILGMTLVCACKARREQSTAKFFGADPCAELPPVAGMRTFHQQYYDGRLKVRVGVMETQGEPKGDVLFLHGFADRFDNHLPLFEKWRDAGLQVISFDFPGHGESCGSSNRINSYSFSDLADLANKILNTTGNSRRPLILAGWSTGGLLATRMMQESTMAPDRRPHGAILFAPGVAVQALVGDWGRVTQASLTRNPNPPHRGPIKPSSPLKSPFFAKKLVANSLVAQWSPLPNIPVMVVVGSDDTDHYVDASKVVSWARWQVNSQAKPVQLVTCAGGFHELDNEPEPMGGQVRALAAWYAKSRVLNLDEQGAPGGPCELE